MDWQTTGAFVVAVLVLFVTPGQIMATVAGTALQGGKIAGFRAVLGIGLGEAMLIVAALLSLCASDVLVSSLFPWISLLGAAYLFWLCLNMLRPGTHVLTSAGSAPPRRPFFNGFVVALSNPTMLLFYSAFILQFIDRAKPVAPQAMVLASVYLAMSIAFDVGCVLVAARVRPVATPSRYFRHAARLACALVYCSTGIASFHNFLTM